MIAELLTGLIAGFTGGYLYRDRREETKDISGGIYAGRKGVERLKKMSGIGEPVDKVTISGEAKNKDEPFWWQKFGAERHYKVNGKYPENKEEMDTLQKKNWESIRGDEEEGRFYLTREAKRQYRESE